MTLALVNGCFDVLHVGHLALFEFAKENCDQLYVLIDSDEMVREAKGEGRPFNCHRDRIKMLESLRTVDQVRVFNDHDDLITACRIIGADIHIVGAEYKDKPVIGSEFAKEVMFFEKVEGYSTTNILNGK